MMLGKRSRDNGVILRHHEKKLKANESYKQGTSNKNEDDKVELEGSTREDINAAFGTILESKPVKAAKVFKKKQKKPKVMKDENNYIGYTAKDHHTEAG